MSNRIDWTDGIGAARTYVVSTDGRHYPTICALDLDAGIAECGRIKGTNKYGALTLESDGTPEGNVAIDRCPFRLVSDVTRGDGRRIVTIEWTGERPNHSEDEAPLWVTRILEGQ